MNDEILILNKSKKYGAYLIKEGETVCIGRSEECSIRVIHDQFPDKLCEIIFLSEHSALVKNLSKNTPLLQVNSKPVKSNQVLSKYNVIAYKDFSFVWRPQGSDDVNVSYQSQDSDKTPVKSNKGTLRGSMSASKSTPALKRELKNIVQSVKKDRRSCNPSSLKILDGSLQVGGELVATWKAGIKSKSLTRLNSADSWQSKKDSKSMNSTPRSQNELSITYKTPGNFIDLNFSIKTKRGRSRTPKENRNSLNFKFCELNKQDDLYASGRKRLSQTSEAKDLPILISTPVSESSARKDSKTSKSAMKHVPLSRLPSKSPSLATTSRTSKLANKLNFRLSKSSSPTKSAKILSTVNKMNFEPFILPSINAKSVRTPTSVNKMNFQLFRKSTSATKNASTLKSATKANSQQLSKSPSPTKSAKIPKSATKANSQQSRKLPSPTKSAKIPNSTSKANSQQSSKSPSPTRRPKTPMSLSKVNLWQSSKTPSSTKIAKTPKSVIKINSQLSSKTPNIVKTPMPIVKFKSALKLPCNFRKHNTPTVHKMDNAKFNIWTNKLVKQSQSNRPASVQKSKIPLISTKTTCASNISLSRSKSVPSLNINQINYHANCFENADSSNKTLHSLRKDIRTPKTIIKDLSIPKSLIKEVSTSKSLMKGVSTPNSLRKGVGTLKSTLKNVIARKSLRKSSSMSSLPVERDEKISVLKSEIDVSGLPSISNTKITPKSIVKSKSFVDFSRRDGISSRAISAESGGTSIRSSLYGSMTMMASTDFSSLNGSGKCTEGSLLYPGKDVCVAKKLSFSRSLLEEEKSPSMLTLNLDSDSSPQMSMLSTPEKAEESSQKGDIQTSLTISSNSKMCSFKRELDSLSRDAILYTTRSGRNNVRRLSEPTIGRRQLVKELPNNRMRSKSIQHLGNRSAQKPLNVGSVQKLRSQSVLKPVSIPLTKARCKSLQKPKKLSQNSFQRLRSQSMDRPNSKSVMSEKLCSPNKIAKSQSDKWRNTSRQLTLSPQATSESVQKVGESSEEKKMASFPKLEKAAVFARRNSNLCSPVKSRLSASYLTGVSLVSPSRNMSSVSTLFFPSLSADDTTPKSSRKSPYTERLSDIKSPIVRSIKRKLDALSRQEAKSAAKQLKEEPPKSLDKKKVAALLKCHGVKQTTSFDSTSESSQLKGVSLSEYSNKSANENIDSPPYSMIIEHSDFSSVESATGNGSIRRNLYGNKRSSSFMNDLDISGIVDLRTTSPPFDSTANNIIPAQSAKKGGVSFSCEAEDGQKDRILLALDLKRKISLPPKEEGLGPRRSRRLHSSRQPIIYRKTPAKLPMALNKITDDFDSSMSLCSISSFAKKNVSFHHDLEREKSPKGKLLKRKSHSLSPAKEPKSILKRSRRESSSSKGNRFSVVISGGNVTSTPLPKKTVQVTPYKKKTMSSDMDDIFSREAVSEIRLPQNETAVFSSPAYSELMLHTPLSNRSIRPNKSNVSLYSPCQTVKTIDTDYSVSVDTSFDFNAVPTPNISKQAFVSTLRATRSSLSDTGSVKTADSICSFSDIASTSFDFNLLKTPNVSKEVFVSTLKSNGRSNLESSLDKSSSRAIPELIVTNPTPKSMTTGSSRSLRSSIIAGSSTRKQIAESNINEFASSLSGSTGVKKMSKTPNTKEIVSPIVKRLQGMFATLKEKDSSIEDNPNVESVKKMSINPKASESRQYIDKSPNVSGVQRMFASPNSKQSIVDYHGIAVKKMFATPNIKESKEPLADYSSISGLRNLFKSPDRKLAEKNSEETRSNGYSNLTGVRELFAEPTSLQNKSSLDDSNIKVNGVKKLFSLQCSDPLMDLEGARKLFLDDSSANEVRGSPQRTSNSVPILKGSRKRKQMKFNDVNVETEKNTTDSTEKLVRRSKRVGVVCSDSVQQINSEEYTHRVTRKRKGTTEPSVDKNKSTSRTTTKRQDDFVPEANPEKINEPVPASKPQSGTIPSSKEPSTSRVDSGIESSEASRVNPVQAIISAKLEETEPVPAKKTRGAKTLSLKEPSTSRVASGIESSDTSIINPVRTTRSAKLEVTEPVPARKTRSAKTLSLKEPSTSRVATGIESSDTSIINPVRTTKSAKLEVTEPVPARKTRRAKTVSLKEPSTSRITTDIESSEASRVNPVQAIISAKLEVTEAVPARKTRRAKTISLKEPSTTKVVIDIESSEASRMNPVRVTRSTKNPSSNQPTTTSRVAADTESCEGSKESQVRVTRLEKSKKATRKNSTPPKSILLRSRRSLAKESSKASKRIAKKAANAVSVQFRKKTAASEKSKKK